MDAGGACRQPQGRVAASWLTQPMVVEHKNGAASAIACEMVAGFNPHIQAEPAKWRKRIKAE